MKAAGIALISGLALIQTLLLAFDSAISGAAIERALKIARSRDVERARFHRPYIIDLNGPLIDSIAVENIEIVTEFRRMELIGEEHVRVNDTFGRAGIREAEAALQPWRNRVALVARLRFGFPVPAIVISPPPINIVVEGDVPITPLTTNRNIITSGDGGIPISGTVEAVFAADALKTQPIIAVVEANGDTLARVPIELRAVE